MSGRADERVTLGPRRRWKTLSLSTVAQLLSMDVCALARRLAPGLRWKARELTQLQKPTNSIGAPGVNSYVASLPQIATCSRAFQVP